jgi:hypothetical protein
MFFAQEGSDFYLMNTVLSAAMKNLSIVGIVCESISALEEAVNALDKLSTRVLMHKWFTWKVRIAASLQVRKDNFYVAIPGIILSHLVESSTVRFVGSLQ